MGASVLQSLDECHIAVSGRIGVWKSVCMGMGNAPRPLMQAMRMHSGLVHLIHVYNFSDYALMSNYAVCADQIRLSRFLLIFSSPLLFMAVTCRHVDAVALACTYSPL